MPTPYEKTAAVVVLPAVAGGRLRDAALRRWLARGDVRRIEAPREWLGRILGALNLPAPEAGLGALRMWGQTGERPKVWIAAADPVYLEPRLDHLCVHALDAGDVPAADLRPLIDHLQARLGDETGYGFARLGTHGYLRAAEPIATAAVPPYVAHLDLPNDYLPAAGPGADAYRRLVSEVEMALHEHDVNRRREGQGKPPVSGLWFWGGGPAPEQVTVPHPPLFTDDPLLTGYWLSKTGVVAGWPGDIGRCVEASVAGFVAVAPECDDPGRLADYLRDLRGLLHAGRLSRLTLMFRDGIEASLTAAHRWRLWRRVPPLLDADA